MSRSHIITYKRIQSPIGDFLGGSTGRGICLFEFADRGGEERIAARLRKRYDLEMKEGSDDLLQKLQEQVGEYFAGHRTLFDLPLDQKGTRFEREVWDLLTRIPCGETVSYGAMAERLGKPGAARAVGRANGANYIAVIVPCHRVIEASGALRGYGGGLWRKKWLLDHEKKMTGAMLPLKG